MLSQEKIDRIRQAKIDALVAIELYKKRITNLQRINRSIEALSIAVPVFYFIPKLLAKGTAIENIMNNIGEVLAGILLVLAILKLVYKWQDDEIKSAILSRQNRDVSLEATHFLEAQNTTREAADQFLKRVSDLDSEDQALLGEVPKSDRQKAYREALKRFAYNRSVQCEICGANPWIFTPGSCDACGGTPI